jgi:hypothetical protein
MHHDSITYSQKDSLIRSHMLLIENFDKLKSRLVAGEHIQDRSSNGEGVFPAQTVSLTSVYTLCSLTAKEKRHVVTMDVPGAFPNSNLKAGVIMILEYPTYLGSL